MEPMRARILATANKAMPPVPAPRHRFTRANGIGWLGGLSASGIFALVLFYASVCSAIPCLTGTTPATGAKGFQTPVHRACDWDTNGVNANWDLLNSDKYVHEINVKN